MLNWLKMLMLKWLKISHVNLRHLIVSLGYILPGLINVVNTFLQ